MENNFIIAIIGAASAIAGAIVPQVFNLIGNKQKAKQELLLDLHNTQKVIYLEFLLNLQRLMNNKTPKNFYLFQESVNKILLYGDNNTSKQVNIYFKNLVKEANKQLIEPLDHKSHQQKIVNSMRNHLKMDKFDDFELICFTPERDT